MAYLNYILRRTANICISTRSCPSSYTRGTLQIWSNIDILSYHKDQPIYTIGEQLLYYIVDMQACLCCKSSFIMQMTLFIIMLRKKQTGQQCSIFAKNFAVVENNCLLKLPFLVISGAVCKHNISHEDPASYCTSYLLIHNYSLYGHSVHKKPCCLLQSTYIRAYMQLCTYACTWLSYSYGHMQLAAYIRSYHGYLYTAMYVAMVHPVCYLASYIATMSCL